MNVRSRLNAFVIAASTVLAFAQVGVVRVEAAGFVTGGFKGLDSCTDPTISQMQAFWNGTPYYNWYVYIGGSTMTCPQPNLSTTWINTVIGNVPNPTMHWDLMPIWVGLQAPCNHVGAATFSLNTSTAYNQGVNEAAAAATKWHDTYGQSWSTPIAYDLEPFDAPLTGGCSGSLAAAQSFISGYVHQLHIAPAQKAGLAGAACDSHIQRFVTIANVPDFIWPGDWGTAPDPAHISCISDGYWTSHQRHKQWQAPHNETQNGVTLNVDGDCSNGYMYGLWNNGWGAC
jgi:glycoside hydrolase-like protein